MALVKWKDDYFTGHGGIDADHRRLFDLINAVYDVWAAGRELGALAFLFDELVTYAETHFAREEDALAAIGWEGLADHRAEHESLRRMAVQFREDYLAGEDPAPFSAEIRDFLRIWLSGHVLEEDMKYRHLFSDHA